MANRININADITFDSSEIDLDEIEESIQLTGQVKFSDVEVKINMEDIDTDDLVQEILSRSDVSKSQADEIVDEMLEMWPSLEEGIIENADIDHYEEDEPENLLEAMKQEVLQKLGEAMSLEQLERTLDGHLKWQKRHREKEIRERGGFVSTFVRSAKEQMSA